jgi:DNA-binding PadR family transcriptional regulator
MGREALQSALGLADRKSFRERYLRPALDDGLIEMTIPDKPNSRLQKYRLTDKGRQLVEYRKKQATTRFADKLW